MRMIFRKMKARKECCRQIWFKQINTGPGILRTEKTAAIQARMEGRSVDIDRSEKNEHDMQCLRTCVAREQAESGKVSMRQLRTPAKR